jgi:hypothetical protein
MTKIAVSGSISQRHGSADPDPYQRIRNTALVGKGIVCVFASPEICLVMMPACGHSSTASRGSNWLQAGQLTILMTCAVSGNIYVQTNDTE